MALTHRTRWGYRVGCPGALAACFSKSATEGSVAGDIVQRIQQIRPVFERLDVELIVLGCFGDQLFTDRGQS